MTTIITNTPDILRHMATFRLNCEHRHGRVKRWRMSYGEVVQALLEMYHGNRQNAQQAMLTITSNHPFYIMHAPVWISNKTYVTVKHIHGYYRPMRMARAPYITSPFIEWETLSGRQYTDLGSAHEAAKRWAEQMNLEYIEDDLTEALTVR